MTNNYNTNKSLIFLQKFAWIYTYDFLILFKFHRHI